MIGLRVVGHLKSDHRMDRDYLWHREGDAANASWPPSATTSAARSLAEHLVASIPQRSPGGASTRPSLSATFFTDNFLVWHLN